MESEAKPEPVAVAKPKRRWWQYSTRALMLAVTVCALGLGLWVNLPPIEKRSGAPFLESAGGVVYSRGRPHNVNGLLKVDVVDLSFSKVTDKRLVCLQEFAALERLHLANTRISDAGLAHLKGLKALRYLDLRNTWSKKGTSNF